MASCQMAYLTVSYYQRLILFCFVSFSDIFGHESLGRMTKSIGYLMTDHLWLSYDSLKLLVKGLNLEQIQHNPHLGRSSNL